MRAVKVGRKRQQIICNLSVTKLCLCVMTHKAPYSNVERAIGELSSLFEGVEQKYYRLNTRVTEP